MDEHARAMREPYARPPKEHATHTELSEPADETLDKLEAVLAAWSYQ